MVENGLEGTREKSVDDLPSEHYGIAEEVIVRRTKTATASKRKANDDSTVHGATYSLGSLGDEITSVNKAVLSNMRNGWSLYICL